MKKHIIYTLAAGVLFLSFAACTKEKDNNEEQQNPKEATTLITEVLTATKEGDATKVTMTAGGKFGWTTSDKAAFSIYDGSTEKYTFVESGNYVVDPGTFTVSYTGTRTGYAVIPSSFVNCDPENDKVNYDGSILTVTYPDTYDIRTEIAAGCYNNADGDHFIPFPMVATSTPGNSELEFFSIGALVRVVMNHIPAGTKNLYITFNQTVTGDFTVVNPGTSTSYVAVSAEEKANPTPSTVTFQISDSGLDAERSITLYIPVPTTEGLGIASSATTKATVARNVGYSWTVDAITNLGNGSFNLSLLGTYIVAPGNLLVYNNSGEIEYSFLSGTDQLITTRGAKSNDPHQDIDDGSAIAPTWPPSDGEYQDEFLWDDLRTIMGDTGEITSWPYDFETNSISISGNTWKVPSVNETWGLLDSRMNNVTDYYRVGNKATVHGFIYASGSKVRVDVAGSDYASYALIGTTVPGALWFPDGYVDQTDLVSAVSHYRVISNTSHTYEGDTKAYSNNVSEAPVISYKSFKAMADEGVIFLPAAGYYRNMNSNPTFSLVGTAGIYGSSTQIAPEPETNSYSQGFNFSGKGWGRGGRRSHYSFSVRLVRKIADWNEPMPEGAGKGQDFSWDK